MKHFSALASVLLGLAFHVFLTQGAGLTDPPILIIGILSVFLLFTERKAWLGLVK
ncbi:MAG: hypothetical protein NTX35_13015 [Verrucomicrobia bacterium]|nr:hypothetical protein [Verrucomicrobiota bacterium]